MPGLMEKALVLTAIPAFLVGLGIVRGFAHLGVSEVTTFMTTMPVCITLWFYSAGWLFDRWKYKRRARLATSVHSC
jgi:high-affinity Fe2+/Pb2+ permease